MAAQLSQGMRVLLHRGALRRMRPELGTIRLDPRAATTWPEDLSVQVAALEARAVDRPGIVALDPGRDDDFILALALAPFSATVEAVSKGGQVWLERRGEEAPRLMLTEQDVAGLPADLSAFSVADSQDVLIHSTKPRPSSFWNSISRLETWFWLVTGLAWGPVLVVSAISRLEFGSFWGLVVDVVRLLFAVVIFSQGVGALRRLIRSRRRRRPSFG